MTTVMLIAQMPISGDWSDPSDWAQFFRVAGPVVGFMVVVLLTFAFLVWCSLRWLFGANGWVKALAVELKDRFLKFLDTIEQRLGGAEVALQKHLQNCEEIHQGGGPCNVADLRNAGHEFAEMGKRIGQQIGADVDDQATRIHSILQGAPVILAEKGDR